MRIEADVKLDYSDVLFRPKRSTMGSRKEVDLHREFRWRNTDKTYRGVPIMAANMQGVGTFNMALALAKKGMFTCLDKSYSVADIYDWMIANEYRQDLMRTVAFSTGITDVDAERIDKLLDYLPDVEYVCIDVANGYSERFINYVADFKQRHPDVVIIAGNVVTPDITEELILNGADIVKVGIGPGSVCTTRVKTGVGYPQLSAVIECADAAHGLGGHIIADGGCTSAGDVAKAFGGGADFVMLGGMFAGCDEGGGEVITKHYATDQIQYEVGNHTDRERHMITKQQFVKFYGSSTTVAQEFNGGVQEHRTSEGRVVEVPYKGSVNSVITDILGGVRSACTYVGAKKLKHLSKCTTFIQVNGGKTHNTVFAQYQTGE